MTDIIIVVVAYNKYCELCFCFCICMRIGAEYMKLMDIHKFMITESNVIIVIFLESSDSDDPSHELDRVTVSCQKAVQIITKILTNEKRALGKPVICWL